ncbi:MAG: ATP-binding cassette domain-containing protein [Actinobacteria bacterium]|nr:ATP-binding cassette domain-containing protein [Actinomycetota bacterium]
MRSSGTSTPAVTIRGVTKSFGEVRALDGIDLEVAAGTVFGLLGPNGAGKTTTVRILTTTVRPDGGRAEVLGVDVARFPRRVRSLIGLAGQYAAVDERLTGRENLILIGQLTHQPRRRLRARADELLESFKLTRAADRPISGFSGGMRRRLDLAASLVHHPQVLFLDEPTTGLDPRSRNDLWAMIRKLVDDGTTVLLTTQYLEEAEQLADAIAVIDHGRVIAEGTASSLKASLGATIIEVTFATPGEARGALSALDRIIPGAGVDDLVVGGPVVGGAARSLDVVRALDAARLAPTGLTVREPSLDDVFLALTGRTATHTGDPDSDVERTAAMAGAAR